MSKEDKVVAGEDLHQIRPENLTREQQALLLQQALENLCKVLPFAEPKARDSFFEGLKKLELHYTKQGP